MLILLLSVFTTLSQAKFVATKNKYNGTLYYDGLAKACLREFPASKPCDKVNLLKGFWHFNLSPSWILTLNNNCLGYTTNSTEVDGSCLSTSFGYVTTCSCDMFLSCCCKI